MNYTITPEQAASSWYEQALQYELFAGKNSDLSSLERSSINHPAILEYKGRILGNRHKVSEFADWTEFLLRDFGPKSRCLSLGSGLGRVENYLMRIGFTDRFEAIELCADENELQQIDKSKATVKKGDLNFTELPPERYDFVLCHGVLHHLINIEFVLDQVNKTLKPDGLLLIYEYVGETRWQFMPQRMQFLRAKFPHLTFRVPLPCEIKGFESVRSADLLGLIRVQFGESPLKGADYGGVYFPFVICSKSRNDDDLTRAIELDMEVSQQRLLSPCYHMGVYRKSRLKACIATPWKDEELQAKLGPKCSLPDRLLTRLRMSRLGSAVRSAKRLLS
jgi:SAM-dependent methyltransferase